MSGRTDYGRDSQRWAARTARARRASALLEVIAACGRRFFHRDGRVARFEVDDRGRVWLRLEWPRDRMFFLHRPEGRRWNQWPHGGTLKRLVIALRDYITSGEPIGGHFGPWPSFVSGGDLWGYGDEAMAEVRAAARALGILRRVSDSLLRTHGAAEAVADHVEAVIRG